MPCSNLYNPPSPTTIHGAKSGTIGYTTLETQLLNIEDTGCQQCIRNNEDCVGCGLQYNTAGVFCFANGFYDRARRHFTKAVEIEKRSYVSDRPEKNTLHLQPTEYVKTVLYQDKGQVSYRWRQAVDGIPYSHSKRLSGYLHNLALSKNSEKHQIKFYKPTYGLDRTF